MARNNLYHVIYHFAGANGKRVIGPFGEFVQASAPTAVAVITVLNSNGINAPGGYTIDVERIANAATPNALS